jgi:hypothetical protein
MVPEITLDYGLVTAFDKGVGIDNFYQGNSARIARAAAAGSAARVMGRPTTK